MPVKKVAFKTLGCRLNQFETDSLATQFKNGGYQIVDFADKADVYVVNSCTVTNQSDRKSRNVLSQASRKNKGAVVVLTGCMANSDKESLEESGMATYVVENKAEKVAVYSLVQSHYNGEVQHPMAAKNDLFGFQPATEGFHTRQLGKRCRMVAIIFARFASFRRCAEGPQAEKQKTYWTTCANWQAWAKRNGNYRGKYRAV
ncbi:MAG: hypothetical protein HC896_03720 [Bacteroidales bacterium]|nr:hypothetical protein [Bacteroidales bacterium]